MGPRAIEALEQAIRKMHGADASFVEAVPIHEAFEGETVWEGIVHVFDLEGHPNAARAYAWSELVDEVTGRQRFWAILHRGPVDSPRTAVQAFIVQRHREQEADGNADEQGGGAS